VHLTSYCADSPTNRDRCGGALSLVTQPLMDSIGSLTQTETGRNRSDGDGLNIVERQTDLPFFFSIMVSDLQSLKKSLIC